MLGQEWYNRTMTFKWITKSFRMTPVDPVQYEKSKATLRVALQVCLLGSVGFFVLSPLYTFLFGSEALEALSWKSTIVTMAGYLCWTVLILLGLIHPAGQSLLKGRLGSGFPWLPLPILTLVIFLLWSLVCSIFSQWPATAFFGNWWRHEGWIQYLAYAGLFTAAISLTQKRKWPLIRSFWFITAAISCLLGLAERSGYRPFAWSLSGSAISFFINQNHFAYFLCMTAVLSSALWIRPETTSESSKRSFGSLIRSLAAPALSLLLFTTLVYAQTRGSSLALLGGLTLLGFLLPGKRSLRSFLPLFTAISVFILLYVVDGALSTYKIVLIGTDVSAIITNPGSTQALEAGGSRWLLWVDGIKYFLQSPWIGNGPDTTGFFLQRDGIQFSDRLHNEYLEYLVTLGIPGLLAWLAFLYASIHPVLPWSSWRFRRVPKAFEGMSIEAVAAACAALTYLASAFFGNSLTYTAPFLFLLLGRCATDSLHPDPKHLQNLNP